MIPYRSRPQVEIQMAKMVKMNLPNNNHSFQSTPLVVLVISTSLLSLTKDIPLPVINNPKNSFLRCNWVMNFGTNFWAPLKHPPQPLHPPVAFFQSPFALPTSQSTVVPTSSSITTSTILILVSFAVWVLKSPILMVRPRQDFSQPLPKSHPPRPRISTSRPNHLIIGTLSHLIWSLIIKSTRHRHVLPPYHPISIPSTPRPHRHFQS